MIYRIRIMRLENGVLVFDRYATDGEMKYLRVNADGVVEGAQIKMPVDDRIFQKLIDVRRDLDIYWVKMDNTHLVEWGECLTSTPIYENDIILIHDGDGICYEAKEGIFALMDFYTNYLVNGSPYCEIEVIGNVWGSKWS